MPLIVVQARDASVAENDAMGIAGQIADHRLGVGQARLGVDHPLLGHQGIEQGRDRAGIEPGPRPVISPALAAPRRALTMRPRKTKVRAL